MEKKKIQIQGLIMISLILVFGGIFTMNVKNVIASCTTQIMTIDFGSFNKHFWISGSDHSGAIPWPGRCTGNSDCPPNDGTLIACRFNDSTFSTYTSNRTCASTVPGHGTSECVGNGGTDSCYCSLVKNNCSSGACKADCSDCETPVCTCGSDCCKSSGCPSGDSDCSCSIQGGDLCDGGETCSGGTLNHSGAGTCCDVSCTGGCVETCADECVTGSPSNTDSGAGTCCDGESCRKCEPACTWKNPKNLGCDCGGGCTEDCSGTGVVGCRNSVGAGYLAYTGAHDNCCDGDTCCKCDTPAYVKSGSSCVLADDPPTPPTIPTGGLVNIDNPITTADFNELVENVLNWVLGIAGSVALLILIAGGVMYATAAGSEEKLKSAKKTILYAILGVVIVILSYSMIKVLHTILT